MTSDHGDSSSLRPRSPLISPDVCLNCKQPMVMVCPESKDTETGHWTLEFERERECEDGFIHEEVTRMYSMVWNL